MWRAFFLAVGINLCIMGAQCLVVEKIVLADHQKVTPESAQPTQSLYKQVGYQQTGDQSKNGKPDSQIYEPKSWIPWSLLASGAIVILYTHSLPKRNAAG